MNHKPKICARCGKKFIPNGNHQKYCDSCRVEMRKQWKKETYEKYKNLQGYKLKVCPVCGKTFKPKSGNQLYCSKECANIVRKKQNIESAKQWVKQHPDRVKIRRKEYYKDNLNKFKQKGAEYYKQHTDEIKQRAKQWGKEHPEERNNILRKCIYKRKRHLGFIPINKWFKGSDAHHFDKNHVIYIPGKLHESVGHNIWTGKNMAKINHIAIHWAIQNCPEVLIMRREINGKLE